MKNKIIIALDFPNFDIAIRFVDLFLDPKKHAVKIGTNLLFGGGMILQVLKGRGYEVMLDCKFLDTPDTIFRYAEEAANARVDMFTVHSIMGPDILDAALNGVNSVSGSNSPKVVAITILTSMSEESMRFHLNISGTVADESLQHTLEEMAFEAGCDGVVLNGNRLPEFNKLYPSMLTVVPGIRGTDDDLNCQKEVVTPRSALENGADFIVVGRHVTASDDPKRRLLELEWAVDQF